MPWPGLHLDTSSTPGLTHLSPDRQLWFPKDPFGGEVSCGFVAFEFREREIKSSKKATTQEGMGILLQKEESGQK